MDTIYFQGIWRMDWGLGNPNKTAALIALLMLVVWTLPLLRRWLFWAALPAFTALGMCLMHTMSRGGVVAAAAGFAVLLARLRRTWPWPWGRALAVAVAVAVILAGAVVFQTTARFANSPRDRSVSNRLAIWGRVPRMMAEAPWGWGIGNSGKAYMGWYQPLENTEQYRTLVNSHLTWLVELGWPTRALYALGWAAVFVVCGGPFTQRRERHKGDKRSLPCFRTPERPGFRTFSFCGIVCGIWAAFFVAAAFSSVAESPCLWILPVSGLAGVLAVRFKQRLWPSRSAWACGAAAAALGLGVLAVCGYASAPPAGAGRLAVLRGGVVCAGARPPKTWVVAGTGAVSETYPRDYRAWQTRPPAGFAPSLAALPKRLDGCRLVVMGSLGDWGGLAARAKACESLLLIAPDVFPDELDLPGEIPTRVVFGEFTSRASAAAWRGTGLAQTLEGAGDFFQDWPEIIWGSAGERIQEENAF